MYINVSVSANTFANMHIVYVHVVQGFDLTADVVLANPELACSGVYICEYVYKYARSTCIYVEW